MFRAKSRAFFSPSLTYSCAIYLDLSYFGAVQVCTSFGLNLLWTGGIRLLQFTLDYRPFRWGLFPRYLEPLGLSFLFISFAGATCSLVSDDPIIIKMFLNSYQNGPYLQIWDSKANPEKNPFDRLLFKTVPAAKKEFDKEAKSFLYTIQGQNARMILPADDTKALSIHQRYIVLQIFIPLGSPWSMELGLSDLNGNKRRVNITTSQGKQETKYFSLRYPVDFIEKGQWLYLGVDVLSFMDAFRDQVFRSLDHLAVGSTCRLRRIFSMKEFVEWEVPKQYWFSQQIRITFQLITYTEKHKNAYLEMSQQLQSSQLSGISPKISANRPNKSLITRREQQSYLPQIPQSPQISKQKSVLLESKIVGQSKRRSDKTISSYKTGSVVSNAKLKLSKLEKREKELLQKTLQQEGDSPVFRAKLQQMRPANEGRRRKIFSKSFEQDNVFTPLEEESSEREVVHPEKNQDRWQEQPPQLRPIRKKIVGDVPTTIITRQNDREVVIMPKRETELELIFDEMVGCYYHPETNTYYEIKQ